MATTDPTKALHAAQDAAVKAITEIGDPTTRYTATLTLAAWHHDQAAQLLADPPQPELPAPEAETPTPAAKS